MQQRLILALIAVAALAGCAGHHHHHGGDGPRGMHFNPMVTAKGGVVSISPEPLVFLKGEKDVDITWRLPPGLSFPDNGIVIEGRVIEAPKGAAAAARRQGLDPKQDEIVCPRQGGGATFTCKNRNSKPGIYKYTIRVLQDGKPLPAFDPEIMNLD